MRNLSPPEDGGIVREVMAAEIGVGKDHGLHAAAPESISVSRG